MRHTFHLLCFLILLTGCKEKPTTVIPNPVSLLEMMGVCVGPNIDGYFKMQSFQPKEVIPNVRYYYLQEKDFDYQGDPASYDVVPCPVPCDDYSCWNTGRTPMADHKYRICKLRQAFEEVYVSWEAIFVKGKQRGYPNKWYSAEEWGKEPQAIARNAQNYTEAWLKTYCVAGDCLVDVLEIGNEPWGKTHPGVEAYHAILNGVIESFTTFFGSKDPEGWKIKLSTPGFQARASRPGLHDGVAEMIPPKLRKYFSYLSIHAYSRSADGRFDGSPMRNHPKSFYYQIRALEQWRRENMPQAKLNLTEFGWNSKDIGDQQQCDYLIQSLMIAQRFGVHRAFIYQIEDTPGDDLFNSMGLFNNKTRKPKPVYQELSTFLEKFGDLHFMAIYEENEERISYGFGKGKRISHLFTWNLKSNSLEVKEMKEKISGKGV